MRNLKEVILESDIPYLEAAGFISELRKEESTLSAFLKIEDKLSLPEAERKIIKDAFSKIGRGYLEDDVRIISGAEEEIRRLAEEFAEELKKREKLSIALSFSLSFGLVILLF